MTDKIRIIEMLVANENVLLFLYEKMFPTKSDPIVKEMLSNENQLSFFGSSVKRTRGTEYSVSKLHLVCSLGSSFNVIT